MSGVNKVIIIGNLGQEPQMARTNAGVPVATLSIAVNKTWRDKNSGEKREHVEWVRAVIFNEGLAKVAEQYLHKGSKVYLEGELRTRKWTDKSGIDRFTTEVVLSGYGSSLVLCDRSERAPTPSEADYGTQAASSPAPSPTIPIDDGIPF
jgi:single-strand DNA-binding protein